MTKDELKYALASETYDPIIDSANQEKFMLLAAWTDQDLPLLRRRISGLQPVFLWIKRLLGLEDNKRTLMIYRLGYLAGVVGGLNHVLYCDSQMKEAERVHKEILCDIKYARAIVCWLGISGGMSHADLEEKLDFNRDSDASEALNRLVEENIINVTVSGSYKVYSLTDRGMWYFKYLKQEGLTGG